MWFARCASGASLGGLAPAGHASRHRRRPGSGRAPLRRRVPDREPASKRGVPAFRSIAAADDSAVADEDDAFPSGEDASPRWRVRRADASDADAVVRLAAAAGVEWSAAQVTEEVEKGNALVAVSAGNDARDDACADADGPRVSPSSSSAREDADDADAVVAGFIVAWVVADVEVQILEVATRPSMRRRGVASALVRAALDLAPAAEARLECRASNAAARRLYAGLGFAETGVRRRYYADGEDAALLTRVAPVVSARELTRLLAGLSPEAARAPAPPTPEEKQRGAVMHAQDYPRARPAFVRNRSEAKRREANDESPGFRMRNRIRK
jgi:ribosomal-protein-alanine N-acetyltransferase